MPRCLTVAPHLAVDGLEQRYRQCRDPVERSHWQRLWLVAQGHHCPAVASLTGSSGNWVRLMVRRYNGEGPAGVVDRRRADPGAKPLLSPERREALRAALAEPPTDGGRWTCRKVAAWMSEQLGRPVGEPRGWEALQTLGWSPQRPRPRATTAAPAAQDAFKQGGSVRPSPR
jgi:transposase